MKIILSFLFAALMLFSAYNHIVQPEFYAGFIPDFVPAAFANILSAILEAAIGIALIIPKYRHWGGLGFFLLMIAFMPIHIWDFLKVEPAIGSKKAALIRISIQLLLIYAAWWIWKKYKEESL